MIKSYLVDNKKALISLGFMTLATVLGLSLWCHQLGEPLLKAILAVTAVSPYLFFYLAVIFNQPAVGLITQLRNEPRQILGPSAALLVPYLAYCLASQTFHWLGLMKLIGLMLGPLCFAAAAAKTSYGRWTWYDLALIAWIWIPFDLRFLDNIWLWPPGDAEYSLNTLFALSLVCPLYIYFCTACFSSHH